MVVAAEAQLVAAGIGPLADASPMTAPVSGARRFLAFASSDDANWNEHLVGILFDEHSNLLEGTQNLTEVESADPVFRARDQWSPAVDTDGCRSVVIYRDQYSQTDPDVRALTLAHAPAALPYHWLLHDRTTLANSTLPEGNPFVLAPRTADERQRYPVGWSHESTATLQWTTLLRRHDGARSGGGLATRSTRCGGAVLEVGGTTALGADLGVRITNPSGAWGALAGLPTSIALPPCPGCALGTAGFAVLTPHASVTVPGEPTLVGATVASQRFDFGPPVCVGAVRLTDTVGAMVR